MIEFDYAETSDLTKRYFTAAETAAALTTDPVGREAQAHTYDKAVVKAEIEAKRNVLTAAFTQGAYSPVGLQEQLSGRLDGEHIVVLRRNGIVVIPGFQFESLEGSVKLREIVERVNELLDAINDPFGVGTWWLLDHAYLIDNPLLRELGLPFCPASLLLGLSDASLRICGHSMTADEALIWLAEAVRAD